MVGITKRKRGNNEFYYLYHDFKKGERRQRDKYLGATIPENVEQIKQEFEREIYLEEWIPKLEAIQSNYLKKLETLPPSAFEKETLQFSTTFTYNTQRIEGSTLTLKQTFMLLEKNTVPRNRPMHDVKEAESHQRIFMDIISKKEDISLKTILTWHENLLKETKPDFAGKIRDYPVWIGISKFIPPESETLQTLLAEFFTWYESNKNILNPVELAALVHLKFVTIHPFGDGNGRISRLMMNSVLNRLNYPMFIVDYKDRTTYYRALEKAQVDKNNIIFLHWFMKRYLRAQSRYW